MTLEAELVFVADSGIAPGMIASAVEINPCVRWLCPLGAVLHGHSGYAHKHSGGWIRGGTSRAVGATRSGVNVMAVLALRVAHIGWRAVERGVIPVSPLIIVA
jgi:hypothetical protein